MNPEELEPRLARTPRVEPPAAWRNEILAAARAALPASASAVDPVATATRPSPPLPEPGWRTLVTAIRRWLSTFSPWAVPVAGWLVVLALGHAGAWFERPPVTAPPTFAVADDPTHRAATTVAVLAAVRTYRADLASLAGTEDDTTDRIPAPPSSPSPATSGRPGAGPRSGERPRSEWNPPARGGSGPLTVRYA